MNEILAPAGNKECAYAAINGGADAIYLGLTSFSARSSAQNFDFDELEKLIDYAHFFGVRVHVAMNTLVKEEEIPAFIESAIRAHNAGADALIIQDIFLGAYLKKCCSQLCLHLSTQAGVCNAYGARLAKELGYSRVILARETAFSDIAEIAKIIETEVFVQGALCTCFSGQCYFSSFAGGNSGNRGRCKQPCRKQYSIDRKGFEGQAYRLSPSDLCVGENIEKYRKAGVYSFKIEGRMRRAEYVSAAVTYYKNLLSGRATEAHLSALKRTYNRGNYTKGLAFGQDKSFLSPSVQGHIGEYVGTVTPVNGRYAVGSRARFGEGDCFKVLRDGKEVAGAVYLADGKNCFYIASRIRLKNGDKVFITTDASLNAELVSAKREKRIDISITSRISRPVSVIIDGREYLSDFTVQRAENRPTTSDDVLRVFSKKDAYPFAFNSVSADTEEGAFIPASLLNEFRRRVYREYFTQSRKNLAEKIAEVPRWEGAKVGKKNDKTCVIARNLDGVTADIGVLKPDDYSSLSAAYKTTFSGEKFLYLPPFLKGEEIGRLKPAISAFDGIYCGGNYAIMLARELNKKLFLGTGANISNSVGVALSGADYIALSKELTLREQQLISGGNTFILTAGGIKLMDLIYCPFGKSCPSCDRRAFYALTDEAGRKFTLRRYSFGDCRFEIYNCADLVSDNDVSGRLYDFTCLDSAAEASAEAQRSPSLRNYLINYTKGHSQSPVL